MGDFNRACGTGWTHPLSTQPELLTMSYALPNTSKNEISKATIIHCVVKMGIFGIKRL